MKASPLAAGTKAPDLTLSSTPDQKLSLSEIRGRPPSKERKCNDPASGPG
jgi:hypothetical protein